MTQGEVKQENINLVLRAALEMFKKEGCHSASIPRIARRARVTPQTIVNHFKNKDGLITRVLTVAINDFVIAFMNNINASATYQKMKGSEQYIYVYDMVLSMAKKDYEEVNAVLEMSRVLSRKGKLNVEEYCINPTRVLSETLFKAVQKGREDGSIKDEIDWDRNTTMVEAYNLRGVFLQISFEASVKNSNKLFDIDGFINKQLEVCRNRIEKL